VHGLQVGVEVGIPEAVGGGGVRGGLLILFFGG
jgi:hypothetical protein